MEFAVFHAPIMRGAPRDVFRWLVDSATAAEEAGFTEYWVAEHATTNYECVPNPELVLAGAALNTDTIKLCVGAHLPAYHVAASLAVQTAWMSHILEGRYILGIGAGAFPGDAVLRGFADPSHNHEMMIEALEVMEKVWRWEPFHFEGKYYKAGFPEGTEPTGEPFRDSKPWGGKMPIGMAAASPNSPTIEFAAKHGYYPMTLLAFDSLTKNHWDHYARVAAEHGHTVSRDSHRVVKDVFCADTDREARDLAINGALGKGWGDYALHVYKPVFEMMFPNVPKSDITVEWLADNLWIVGSPDTIVEKMEAAFEASGGGWGITQMLAHDWSKDPAPYNYSNALLAREVGPRLKTR